jgi:DNA primase
MISQACIQKILETALVEEVIGDDLELKKAGSNYSALSPFSNEKSPSFMVSPAKQIWKCFSSGKGGNNAAGFLMEYKNMTYPEALKTLADRYNIELEFEDIPEKSDEKKEFESRCEKVLQYANNSFMKFLAMGAEDKIPALKYLTVTRGLSEETLIEWQIGFAPDAWQSLTQNFIDKGYYAEAEHLGLTKSSKGNNYDFYRNRIIFPIHDHTAKLVGFGGRALDPDEKAKYMNSKESDFYSKMTILYGLHRAIKAIKDEGKVYLTEGYTDVIAMHQAGIKNTVATCGTSLTVEHARLLSRFTNHVVLLRDGDEAGQKAAARDLNNLMKKGFRVEVCTLPAGEDPDSLCRKMTSEELVEE